MEQLSGVLGMPSATRNGYETGTVRSVQIQPFGDRSERYSTSSSSSSSSISRAIVVVVVVLVAVVVVEQ